MKIAIATNEKSLKGKVAEHFGRTNNFLVYDNKNQDFEIFPNPEAAGETELPPDFLHRQDVKIVISFSLGLKAFNRFKKYNIKTYKAKAGTILDNLRGFENNTLKKLEKEDIF